MLARQGEADPIIDFIKDHSLRSLLPRGIKTWQNGNYKTIINLILVLDELVSTIIKYMVYGTEHGFNYRAIEMIFNVAVPKHALEQKILFKNAP